MALRAADHAQTARRMSAVLQPGLLPHRVGAFAGSDVHASSVTTGRPSCERRRANQSRPSGLPLLSLPPSPESKSHGSVPALSSASGGTPSGGGTVPLASARSIFRRQLSGGLLNFRFSPGLNSPRTASPRTQPPAPNSARTQSSASWVPPSARSTFRRSNSFSARPKASWERAKVLTPRSRSTRRQSLPTPPGKQKVAV